MTQQNFPFELDIFRGNRSPLLGQRPKQNRHLRLSHIYYFISLLLIKNPVDLVIGLLIFGSSLKYAKRTIPNMVPFTLDPGAPPEGVPG